MLAVNMSAMSADGFRERTFVFPRGMGLVCFYDVEHLTHHSGQRSRGESDVEICTIRSVGSEAGQGERGRRFSALRRTLGEPEAGTISWFAIQMGPSSFAIFDTFDDEAGRNAHLNGKVAAALMEKAKSGDLFAKKPEIHKLDILADKLAK
jgi:quinol monooxygenase YgiN